jgi:hypothetical protein
MFWRTKKKPPKVIVKTETKTEYKEVVHSDHQTQINRELLKLINMLAEHKNYAYIQYQRDIVQKLIDGDKK